MSIKRYTPIIIIAIPLLLFLGPLQSFACSCGEFPTFCEKAVTYNKLLVRVISHQTASYPDGFQEFFTQVEVLYDLDQGAYPDTLSLVNQNGVNCNGDVLGITSGDSLIISLPDPPIASWPDELDGVPPFTTYDLFGCGIYFLHVEDGKLGGGENQEEVDLTAFLNDPTNNCPIVLSTDQADLFQAVEIGPNPVQDELRIVNRTEEDISFTLYAMDGRPLRSITLRPKQVGHLPMESLPSGIYLVRQQAVVGEQSRLIIKQ